MKRNKRWAQSAAILAVAVGMLATAGCRPTDVTIGDFVRDFARQSFAALVL